MIRIDSDTHFTPLDAFDDLDPKYAEIGPHFVKLPSGNYRVVYKAREPFVPSHIKPLRENGHPPSVFDAAPRIGAMAQDGFDRQVLIPNNAPFYYDVDGQMGASVSRSFNRAIARPLKRYPDRFIGVALASPKRSTRSRNWGFMRSSFTRTSTAKISTASFSGLFTNVSKHWAFRCWSTAWTAVPYLEWIALRGLTSTFVWDSLLRFSRRSRRSSLAAFSTASPTSSSVSSKSVSAGFPG